MQTIFEALRESHEVQRTLCRRLLALEDLKTRDEVFRALRLELHAHAAAEERFLYVPLLMEDGGLNSSRHALAEHHDIDELLEDMSTKVKRGRKWMATAKKLSKKVHHHLKEEETKFFQVAGKLISATQKKALATKYAKELARMRKVLRAR